jgi:hypothetical protein
MPPVKKVRDKFSNLVAKPKRIVHSVSGKKITKKLKGE